MRELIKRLCSAIALIGVFTYFIYDASIIGVLFSMLVFCIILWEYSTFLQSKKYKIIFILINIYLSVLIIGFIHDLNEVQKFLIYFFAISSISWVLIGIWVFQYKSAFLNDLKVALMGSLVFISAAVSMVIVLSNPMYLLLIIGAVSLADTSAYFIGKKLGRKQIIPNVSPGKTVEGLIGALIITPLTTSMIAIIFNLDAFHFLLFGIAIVLISFIGDIFFSVLKRNKNIKDSSQLIPGHGGFIDLLDGSIAVLPFFSLTALMTYFSKYNFAWINF